MNDLETHIAATFPLYLANGIAQLMALPVPMVCVGSHPTRHFPIFTPKGKAPFDVAGWTLGYDSGGVFIGVELKQSQRKESLAIVAPGRDGAGVEYHQLVSLYELHEAGGVARLVWENGGELRVLKGRAIVNAYLTYEEARKVEARGHDPARGAKSIPWDKFEPVGLDQRTGQDWLAL
jgi:hypothetical protein